MWLSWLWTKGDSILEKRLRYANRQLWARLSSLEDQYTTCRTENGDLKQALRYIARIDQAVAPSPVEGFLAARETAKQALAMAEGYYEKDD